MTCVFDCPSVTHLQEGSHVWPQITREAFGEACFRSAKWRLGNIMCSNGFAGLPAAKLWFCAGRLMGTVATNLQAFVWLSARIILGHAIRQRWAQWLSSFGL